MGLSWGRGGGGEAARHGGGGLGDRGRMGTGGGAPVLPISLPFSEPLT